MLPNASFARVQLRFTDRHGNEATACAWYRTEAERLRRDAENMRDEQVRGHLLTTATMYEQMAEIVERIRDLRSD